MPHDKTTATSFTIEEILGLAKEGRLRIPVFQRGLRWERKHNIELFDSILRGFPIGTLLLWQRPAPKAVLEFGERTVQAPAMGEGYFVVDGQQRLTALIAAMLHPDPKPKADLHALWFNIETKSFVALRGAAPSHALVPLNVFADSSTLMEWAFNWPLVHSPGLREQLFDVGQALREYTFPAYIVQTEDEGQVRLIYTRANRTGVNLQEAEIFKALSTSDQKLSLATIQSQLVPSFGEVTVKTLLRCHRMISGAKLSEELHLSTAVIEADLQNTLNALLIAVGFLKEIGVPHVTLLPSMPPLIALSTFFDRHPEVHKLSDGSRTRLSRWVWQGWFHRHHISNNTDLEKVRTACEKSTPEEAIMHLHALHAHRSDLPKSPGKWVGKSIFTRLYALTMLHRRQESVSPISEMELHLSLGGGAAELFKRLPTTTENEITSRICGTYLEDLSLWPDVFGISTEALQLLNEGKEQAFHAKRAEVLQRDFLKFYGRKVRPDESTQSISSMLAEAK